MIVRLDPDTLNQVETSFASRHELTLREIDVPALNAALDDLGDPPTARLIHRWTVQETKAREDQVDTRSLPGYHSLNSFFSVDLGRRTLPALRDAVERFRSRELPEIESAFVEPAVRPAGVTPDKHTYAVGNEDGQGYVFGAHHKGSEESGINAKAVWHDYDGSGVRIVVMELGWKVEHPELPHPLGNPLPLLDPYMMNVETERDHGTSTLGVIAAIDDADEGPGIVGIAPAVEIPGLASYEYSSLGSWQIVEAITASIDALGPGDVLLLEVQVEQTVKVGTKTVIVGYPLEIGDPWLNAIRLAVRSDITVVEPAGNPAEGLATYDLGSATWTPIDGIAHSLDPLDTTFIDSGAILVGECKSEPFADDAHNRPKVAWYGKRVDCYAWGEDVLTTTCYGHDFTGSPATDTCKDGMAGQARYGKYNGTSAASAIIAGAVVLIQHMHRDKLGVPASPAKVRAILRDTNLGTPIKNIGSTVAVMPDLGKIAAEMALLPEIYVRDSLNDVGAEPSPVVSMSPDIFVLANPLPASPGAPYDDPTQFVPNNLVVPNADNYVYVRISNLSTAAAANGCRAIVYWTPPSTLVLPSDWKEIGWIPNPVDVAPGGQTIAGPLVWHPTLADLPYGGHACFIAQVDHDKDPQPVAAPASVTWDEFLGLIGSSNNVAWKNFDVIGGPVIPFSPPPGGQWAGLPFEMRGLPHRPMEFDFAIIPSLPDDTTVFWRMPKPAHRMLRAAGVPPTVEVVADEDQVVLSLPANRPIHLTGVRLPRDARIPMSFGVFLPAPPDDQHRVRLDIRQYHDRAEVGRITWAFKQQGS